MGITAIQFRFSCNVTRWLDYFSILGTWVANIAQWIRLALQSCRPGFNSQARPMLFSFLVKYLLYCETNENKQKEAGFGQFKKQLKPAQ